MAMNMGDITPPVRQGNIIPFPVGRCARRCTFPVGCVQEVPILPVASAQAQAFEHPLSRITEQIQVHPVVRLRKRLGIKQHVLADLTGLGLTTIKRVEYGQRVSPYTVSALCVFFSERLKRPFEPEELVYASQW